MKRTKCKISVILCTFNSDLNKIILSLKSIINQKFESFELIVADDGSDENNFFQLKEYFIKNHFLNYKLLETEFNRGTVLNIYDALDQAEGKYIKTLGAGDLLYNENCLRDIWNFMEKNNALVAFGKVMGYQMKDKSTVLSIEEFITPKCIKAYKYRYKYLKIKRILLMAGDWISGISLVYEKNHFKIFLDYIVNKVIYTEDIITAVYALKEIRIFYIDTFVVWYEMGTGISTSNSKIWEERLLNDHCEFYKELTRLYPKNIYIKYSYLLRILRKNKLNILSKIIYLICFPEELWFKVKKEKKDISHNMDLLIKQLDLDKENQNYVI